MLKKLDALKKINFMQFFKLQRTRKQLICLLSIVVFIVVIYLISPISLRLDLSSGNAYTLSAATKKIVKNLDDTVMVKFFMSSDVPTRLLPLKTDVIDLLGEYKKERPGKIRYSVLDPKKDQNAASEAKESGIPQLQFSQLDRDKYAVTSSYFGITISYKDKKEILPQVTDIGSLEYNLDAAIYKMTRNELVKIGIIGQQDSFNPQDDELASLKKVLKGQFTLDFLDASSKTIESTYKTLLVFNQSNQANDEKTVKPLQEYLRNGGKVILFNDTVAVSDTLTAAVSKNIFSSLLGDYGIKQNNDLVLSSSSELVNFGNDMVNLLIPYPFWVKTNRFNQKSTYFSNVTALTFPWVSSLSIEKKPDIEMKELVKTSLRSYHQSEPFILNPQSIPTPSQKDLKEFIIALEAKNKKGGRMILVPTSRFVKERFLGRNSDNLEFVLNVINDFASGAALSGIRQRAVMFYPLPDLSENFKDIFKYLNILFLPSIFAIYGAVRLMRQK